MTERLRVSVVIAAYNEEQTLAAVVAAGARGTAGLRDHRGQRRLVRRHRRRDRPAAGSRPARRGAASPGQPGQRRGAPDRHRPRHGRRDRGAGRRPGIRPGRAAPAARSRSLAGKADAVFGSRFLGGEHRVLYFWHSVGNRFLTLLSNMFTNLNLTDMETCYKMVRAPLMKSLVLTSDRFGFEPEVTARLAQARAADLGSRRSPTPAAPTPRARRSAGGTASPRSGTSSLQPDPAAAPRARLACGSPRGRTRPPAG